MRLLAAELRIEPARSRYGYYVVLGVFVILIIFMLRYLHRRNML